MFDYEIINFNLVFLSIIYFVSIRPKLYNIEDKQFIMQS